MGDWRAMALRVQRATLAHASASPKWREVLSVEKKCLSGQIIKILQVVLCPKRFVVKVFLLFEVVQAALVPRAVKRKRGGR